MSYIPPTLDSLQARLLEVATTLASLAREHEDTKQRLAQVRNQLGLDSQLPAPAPGPQMNLPPGYEPIPWIAIREGMDPKVWVLRPAKTPDEPWGSRLTTIGTVAGTRFRADYTIPAWQNLERWVAAGSPLVDADGRLLDNRGFPVSGGDFSPSR